MLHPSRVVRFLGAPLADPGLMGADTWSDSVLTALYAVALTTAGATSLMHEAKVDAVTVPNLSEHLSNAATTAQLSARFGYAAAMKSLNNLLLLGDGETWARQRVDFAGLPEMVRTFLQVAAGAADIPVTRLLGQSPAGLSATGDSDIRNYYDMIAARQEIDLRPQLERLDRLLIASAGVAPGALSFTFRPLWQMDAATKAATALQKAQTTGIYAGLGLWPKDVMAGLVAGQLAEDGIYPDAGAAFEAAEMAAEDEPQQPVRDYSPDQPRDPQGRWSEGGGSATSGHPDDPAPETAPADPPRNLTIHPKSIPAAPGEGINQATPATAPAAAAAAAAQNRLWEKAKSLIELFNAVTPASAQENLHSSRPTSSAPGSESGQSANPDIGIQIIANYAVGALKFIQAYLEFQRTVRSLLGHLANYVTSNSPTVGITASGSGSNSSASTSMPEKDGIRFGKDPNQQYHAFRHIDRAGLSRNDVAEAIRQDLSSRKSTLPSGLYNGSVVVNGQEIGYSSYKFLDGSINVGRITPGK